MCKIFKILLRWPLVRLFFPSNANSLEAEVFDEIVNFKELKEYSVAPKLDVIAQKFSFNSTLDWGILKIVFFHKFVSLLVF